MSEQKNAAKFAFYYMLALLGLIFISLGLGMIIFQIINKVIRDPIISGFQPEVMRTGISMLVIAAPIFYAFMRLIQASLSSGRLEKDSSVRRWLTYFILFVSSVVMIGWLIGTLNNFLSGELTAKFILKALTSILIAAASFTFFLYDIRRAEVAGKKSGVVRAYFYSSLLVIIIVLAASFFYIESPQKARARRHDSLIISNLQQIESAINQYYTQEKDMPRNLEELTIPGKDTSRLNMDMIIDPETKAPFEYKKISKDSYELCANFKLSSKDADASQAYDFYLEPDPRWSHEAGRQCFERKAQSYGDIKAIPAMP